jgi:hypothetical protein
MAALTETRLLDKKLVFELLTTHIDDLYQMSYTTYGVRVKDAAGNAVFECVDISTDRAFAEGFIALVKGRDVAACHLRDILEDYLE